MSRLHGNRWWTALGWLMVASVAAGSLLRFDQPPALEGTDKVQHLLAYSALMYWWGMLRPSSRPGWIAGLLIMGLVLEGLQALTPHRMFEWRDALFNSLGVALGLALLRTPASGLLLKFDRYFFDRSDPGTA